MLVELKVTVSVLVCLFSQVLFSEFINIMVSHPSEAQVWEELEQYEQACAQQVESLGKLIRKAPRHHANFTNTQKVVEHLRNVLILLGVNGRETIL